MQLLNLLVLLTNAPSFDLSFEELSFLFQKAELVFPLFVSEGKSSIDPECLF